MRILWSIVLLLGYPTLPELPQPPKHHCYCVREIDRICVTDECWKAESWIKFYWRTEKPCE